MGRFCFFAGLVAACAILASCGGDSGDEPTRGNDGTSAEDWAREAGPILNEQSRLLREITTNINRLAPLSVWEGLTEEWLAAAQDQDRMPDAPSCLAAVEETWDSSTTQIGAALLLTEQWARDDDQDALEAASDSMSEAVQMISEIDFAQHADDC